uniref:Uncharacterized protein n=1 Tax=Arundo donax TaxID=35708 RepID=A0A0A8XV42_ARUDO
METVPVVNGRAVLVQICGLGDRWHRFPCPVDQAELCSRLHGLAGTLGEAEVDGYEVGELGFQAIGVVLDAPATTPRAERARVDGFTGGELLHGARVAVDVEQVVPRHGSPDDG